MLAGIPEPIRRRIAAIRADHRSGSVALTRRAGEALSLLAGQEPRSGEAFAAQLETSCRLLVAAQPSMAPILNLANSVLLAVEGLRGVDDQRAQVEPAVAAFLKGMETAGQAISKTVAGLIKNGMTVMTHSHSETVRISLVQAAEAGCRFRVIATESRPLCEGAVLAKELGEAGIRVSLIVDAAMMLLLPEADVALVGADALTVRSLVNKIGTSSLALGARKLKKEFYALAGPEKFVPGGYAFPIEMPKEAAEVLARLAPNVAVRNLYFDSTPLAWISGVVSESGILKPGAVLSRLRRIKLHPALG